MYNEGKYSPIYILIMGYKKIALIALVFIGYVLCTSPECYIASGMTTRSLGYGCFTLLALLAAVRFFYVMQVACHAAVREMREQQKKELAERNIKIVYPTLKGLRYIMKQALVMAAEITVFSVIVMLLAPFVWEYILYPFWYVFLGIGMVFFGIFAICTAFMSKVDSDAT